MFLKKQMMLVVLLSLISFKSWSYDTPTDEPPGEGEVGFGISVTSAMVKSNGEVNPAMGLTFLGDFFRFYTLMGTQFSGKSNNRSHAFYSLQMGYHFLEWGDIWSLGAHAGAGLTQTKIEKWEDEVGANHNIDGNALYGLRLNLFAFNLSSSIITGPFGKDFSMARGAMFSLGFHTTPCFGSGFKSQKSNKDEEKGGAWIHLGGGGGTSLRLHNTENGVIVAPGMYIGIDMLVLYAYGHLTLGLRDNDSQLSARGVNVGHLFRLQKNFKLGVHIGYEESSVEFREGDTVTETNDIALSYGLRIVAFNFINLNVTAGTSPLNRGGNVSPFNSVIFSLGPHLLLGEKIIKKPY